MATEDILSQDEVDALINGVDDGDIEVSPVEQPPHDSIKGYDFTNRDRVVRGRMQTLALLNERFARFLRTSLCEMLHRSVEITPGEVQVMKFSEHLYSLFAPTSLNVIQMHPLKGSGLIVFDPQLVFAVLDNYFGGEGRFETKMSEREFTATELRIINKLLQLCFDKLKTAWQPIMDVELELLNHETNPEFASIVNPTDAVIVSSFSIGLDGGSGELHITFPYAALEPIRELLETTIKNEPTEDDGRWHQAIREELMSVDVELSAMLTETKLTVEQVLNLDVGDILPIEMPNYVVTKAEDIPIFRANYGEHNEQAALKIIDIIEHPREIVLVQQTPKES